MVRASRGNDNAHRRNDMANGSRVHPGGLAGESHQSYRGVTNQPRGAAVRRDRENL